MKGSGFRYIYGPLQSWRMGKSLGIDPLSTKEKICNMDCVYCQLGPTAHYVNERAVFVPTLSIVEEIERFFGAVPREGRVLTEDIDYLTFSGRGEPTLAANLGELIRAIKNIRREKIAVITNATLLGDPQLREELGLADYVAVKMDAASGCSFKRINRPPEELTLRSIIDGIRTFSQEFTGRLALQLMFIEANRSEALIMADLAREIPADEIQLNTPLRPSPAPALDEESIEALKEHFKGLPVVSVYDRARVPSSPLCVREARRRHGNFEIGQP